MKKILLSALVLSSLALAASSTFKLIISGQNSSLSAVTVNGKPYIPLETLKSLGVKYSVQGGTITIGSGTIGSSASGTTTGGANERPSLEGCLNESLFNGVWRIKASKLEQISKDGGTPGWGLMLELRNGSKTTLISTDAGVSGTGEGIQLAFADATSLSVDPYDVQKLTYASLPQGGAVIRQLKFYYPNDVDPSTVQTPTKFLLQVDPKGIGFTAKQAGVAFSSASPSFRVRLDCTK